MGGWRTLSFEVSVVPRPRVSHRWELEHTEKAWLGHSPLAKKAGVYRGRKPFLTPERITQLRTRVAAGEKKAALGRIHI